MAQDEISGRVADARARAHQAREMAGSVYRDAMGRVHRIMADPGRTQDWREEQAEKVLAEARPSLAFRLAEMRAAAAGPLEDARHEADGGYLDRQALSDMHQELGPNLTRLAENREGLLRLYRRRFGDPVARRVIEGTIRGAIDSLDDSESFLLAEGYEAARRDLVEVRPEDERRALADVEALQELVAHAEDVAALLNHDLENLAPGGVTDPDQMRGIERESARARIQRYEERRGGSDASGVVDLSGVVR